MLNISLKRITESINLEKYRSFQILETRTVSKILLRIMAVIFIVGVLAMFLPWTQNVRSKGKVTTMNPDDRPQTVQATIGGKIEKWYIKEGQEVVKGDTIMKISEVKEEYMDPQILENTNDQILAKGESIKAYDSKANNLGQQVESLIKSKEVKLRQNEIKIQQVLLKIQSDSIDLVAAKTKKGIADNQLQRIENLYGEGLKSLTDLEAKRLSVQESQAKVTSLENKVGGHRNELQNLKENIQAIINEYDNKIAKSKSERMSAISAKYDANASRNKLESQFNTYAVRQDNYYILAPINGTMTQAIAGGMGELLKAGEPIASIVPSKYNLAVESFVKPVDMPLLSIGQKVRVQFDGWPAIVFSGWPNNSYGTFGGTIVAINNDISKNGKYRVLIGQDPDENPWPQAVRVGGGANTLILLNNVKVGYEIWRQLNGFPADFYNDQTNESVKTKAPLKKIK